jgi:3',5'-cyclic AMP phosphodiesterase CpdA
MFTILHLSDLHVGPPFVPAVAEAVLRIAPRLKLDLTVVSGDLTQRARREQYIQARRFLDRLPAVPRVVVPGNHDVPLFRVIERLVAPHKLYREYICRDLDRTATFDGAVVVALNSTDPRRTITQGRLREKQIEFCQQAFDKAAPGAARIVVAHHHFARAPDQWHSQTLRGGRRAMRCFLDMGVELILGGHLHRAYIGNSLDFFACRPSDRGIIIVQSGTTTSRRGRGRERQKNSFNLIQIDTDTLQVTHYMYMDDESVFAPLSRHLFLRPGKRLTSL